MTRTRKLRRGGGSGLRGLNPFQTPVYVINLEERKDRWTLFMGQKPAVDLLKIRRMKAQNGKELDVFTDKRITPQSRLNILRNDRRTHPEIATLGAVGCTISHANVWRRIVSSGAPYAIVMEDDARFDMDLLLRIQAAAASIPSSTAIWLFGMYKPNLIHERIGTGPWSRVFQFTASHAYAITREAAKKLLEQVYPVEMHVDHYMGAMSTLYDIPIVQHDEVYLPFGGILDGSGKPRAVESNTSQHRLDGCSACHVPDHLSRFFRDVGPRTSQGRLVRGLRLEQPTRRVLTYKDVGVRLKSAE